MKRIKPGKDNKQDRINFVKYWANYVKTNPDEVWSRQQNIIIDSQILNAKNYKLSAKEYLRIKGHQKICLLVKNRKKQ